MEQPPLETSQPVPTPENNTSRMVPGVGMYYDDTSLSDTKKERTVSAKVNPPNSLLLIFVCIILPVFFFITYNYRETLATFMVTGEIPTDEKVLQTRESIGNSNTIDISHKGGASSSLTTEHMKNLPVTTYSDAVAAIHFSSETQSLFPENDDYSKENASRALSENEIPLSFIASSTSLSKDEKLAGEHPEYLWMIEKIKLYSLFESKKEKEVPLFLTQIQNNHKSLAENSTKSSELLPLITANQELTTTIDTTYKKKLISFSDQTLLNTVKKLATPSQVYKKYTNMLFDENIKSLQKTLLEDPKRKLSDPAQAAFFVEYIQASKDEYLFSFEKHMNTCKTPDEFDASFSLYLTKLYAKDTSLGQNSINSLFTYWNMVVENITPLVNDYCIQQKKVDNLVTELQRK